MSMNVSRRGLFGITAGMAAAGPSAVKSALATLGDARSNSGLSMGTAMPDYGSIKDAALVPDGHWMQRELTDMLARRKRISETACPVLHNVDAMRIDGLRSISQVSRARMIAEARMRRDIENELSWINEKISQLKKEIGPLALIGEVLE